MDALKKKKEKVHKGTTSKEWARAMIHIYLMFYLFCLFKLLFPYDAFLLSKVQERKKEFKYLGGRIKNALEFTTAKASFMLENSELYSLWLAILFLPQLFPTSSNISIQPLPLTLGLSITLLLSLGYMTPTCWNPLSMPSPPQNLFTFPF